MCNLQNIKEIAIPLLSIVTAWVIGFKTCHIYIEQYNPNVYISLIAHPEVKNIQYIKVKNIGKTVAFDIQFEVLNEFEFMLNNKTANLSELSFIKNGISSLGPGDELNINIFIDDCSEESQKSNNGEISVLFKNYKNKNVKKQNFYINMKHLYGTFQNKDTYSSTLKAIEFYFSQIYRIMEVYKNHDFPNN